MNFAQKLHMVKGIDPVADAFAGTVYSDIVSLRDFTSVAFVVYKGVGLTGTSTITVEACDDVSASNSTAIPFRYRAITSGDTHGDITAATTSGFTTTAGSSQLYLIELDDEALAASGYGYVRLKAVEGTNSPVEGAILILLGNPRWERETQATAIT